MGSFLAGNERNLRMNGNEGGLEESTQDTIGHDSVFDMLDIVTWRTKELEKGYKETNELLEKSYAREEELLNLSEELKGIVTKKDEELRRLKNLPPLTVRRGPNVDLKKKIEEMSFGFTSFNDEGGRQDDLLKSLDEFNTNSSSSSTRNNIEGTKESEESEQQEEDDISVKNPSQQETQETTEQQNTNTNTTTTTRSEERLNDVTSAQINEELDGGDDERMEEIKKILAKQRQEIEYYREINDGIVIGDSSFYGGVQPEDNENPDRTREEFQEWTNEQNFIQSKFPDFWMYLNSLLDEKDKRINILTKKLVFYKTENSALSSHHAPQIQELRHQLELALIENQSLNQQKAELENEMNLMETDTFEVREALLAAEGEVQEASKQIALFMNQVKSFSVLESKVSTLTAALKSKEEELELVLKRTNRNGLPPGGITGTTASRRSEEELLKELRRLEKEMVKNEVKHEKRKMKIQVYKEQLTKAEPLPLTRSSTQHNKRDEGWDRLEGKLERLRTSMGMTQRTTATTNGGRGGADNNVKI